MSGFGRRCNGPHRTVVGTRIVLRYPDDQGGHDEAGEGRYKQIHSTDRSAGGLKCVVEAELPINYQGNQHCGNYCRGEETFIEGTHDALTCAKSDKKRGEHRSDDANRSDKQWQRHHCLTVCADKEGRAEQHCSHDRNCVGFKKIGGHARTITHIVAHIVRDDAGVAGIIFGNAGFDLSD